MTLESIHIKNRGPLVDFKAEFAPITVIYGPNASGKSLLSNTLRAIEREKWGGPGEAVVTIDGDALHSRDFDQGEYKDRVRVFNANFLRDDVIDGDPSAIVLGPELISDREQIALCEGKLKRLSDFRQRLEDDLRTKADELSQSQTNIGRTIEQVLRTASSIPGFRKELNHYNKAKADARFKRMVDEDDRDRHWRYDAELERLASTITQRASALQPPDTSDLNLEDVRNRASTLCNTRLPDAKLPEAQADSDLRDWLLKGREYLRQEDRCGFCHQDVPKARVEELEAYFNDSLTQLLDKIDTLTNRVSRVEVTLGQASLPPIESVRSDLQDSYKQQVERWTTSREDVLAELSEIKKHLTTKRNNPNEIIVITAMESSWDSEAADAIGLLIQEHNKSVVNLLEACDEYESGVIAGFYHEWQRLKSKVSRRQSQIDNADRRIKKTTALLNELRRLADTRLIAADQLTATVCSFLGHDEIGFELNEKDHSYRLTRHGQPATEFSEGERTALALMYFLKRLEDDSFQKQEGTLVFDDPITSFDEDNLFQAVASIIDKTGVSSKDSSDQPKTFVVLTHHFGLLERLWWAFRRSKARFFQMKCDSNSLIRETSLDELPQAIITEYQVAFNEVSSIAQGSSDINNPENSIRKCMEGFLRRIVPDYETNGGALSTMRRLVDQSEVNSPSADQLRFLVTTANAGSHDSAIVRYARLASGWQQLKQASEILLNLMQAVAEQHYQGMVRLRNKEKKS